MFGVAEITLLYLLSNDIQIDCNYCIFSENAVPLNTCFAESDTSSTLKSYQFVCNGVNDGSIFALHYSDTTCSDSPKQTQILRMFEDKHGCSNNNGVLCSSDDSVLVSMYSDSYYSELRIIINKCAPISVGATNISKFTQCSDESITEWTFNDIGCTSLQSVVTYSYNIIHCPQCTLITDYDASTKQNNLDINYVITNDATSPFPEAMDICNSFVFDQVYSNASYKYCCYFGAIYRIVWKYDSQCNGLYDEHQPLESTQYLDFNCVNYDNTHMYMQPSFVQITRYVNAGLDTSCDPDLSKWQQISYIINACIKQNNATWLIVEAQSSFITIHYFTDHECSNQVSQCIEMWETNDCNMGNMGNLQYYQVIDGYFGEIRESVMSSTALSTTKDPLDLEMSIDVKSKYVETNYINRYNYREPMSICNQLIQNGVKSSYKYMCSKDTNSIKYKKRKWKNKHKCDDDGDSYDEEEDIDQTTPGFIASCDHPHDQDDSIKYCRLSCFYDEYHWEQQSVIINNCIQTAQSSIYMECFSDHTITYYYQNDDCTDFHHKEYWFGKDCESRYSKDLITCDSNYNTPSNVPTWTPVRHVPTPAPIPTLAPTIHPTIHPTDSTALPSYDPIAIQTSSNPSQHPTIHTTVNPTVTPTGNPSVTSTTDPTSSATTTPTNGLTTTPTNDPTTTPTSDPTTTPTNDPTTTPTNDPTITPTINPTTTTTINPTTTTTINPTTTTTINPTTTITINPTTTTTINPTTTTTINPTTTTTTSPTMYPTINPTTNPTLNQTANPTIDVTTHPTTHPTTLPTTHPTTHPTTLTTTQPTTQPTTLTTTQPTTQPTTHPTTHTTTNPTINPTVSPIGDPTLHPTENPAMNQTNPPSIHPALPTLSPTVNPLTIITLSPTVDPSETPTIVPSAVVTTVIPTTLAPAITLIPTTVSPSDPPLTFVPTAEQPTVSPTAQPTSPSIVPTLSPTGRRCNFELYQRYNQTNASYWLSNETFIDRYANFIEEAIFKTYSNLTQHSMNYEDRDEWSDESWRYAGITDYQTCMIFNIKNDDADIPANCPSVPNPDPGNAQFVVVVTFCVVANQNEESFNDYLTDVSDFANFSAIFDFYLNPIIAANTPCCLSLIRRRARRLLHLLYTHITIDTEPINPIKHSKSLSRLPMGYQGIFTNTPAVTGDITILLVIITASMSICALICWCLRHECCHRDQSYIRFDGHNDDMDEHEELKQDGIALPSKQ